MYSHQHNARPCQYRDAHKGTSLGNIGSHTYSVRKCRKCNHPLPDPNTTLAYIHYSNLAYPKSKKGRNHIQSIAYRSPCKSFPHIRNIWICSNFRTRHQCKNSLHNLYNGACRKTARKSTKSNHHSFPGHGCSNNLLHRNRISQNISRVPCYHNLAKTEANDLGECLSFRETGSCRCF